MTTSGFRPTHVVPQKGMPAWEAPDPSRPTVDLDPLLPVQLLERQGDWGHVLCFNGWSAWVDGRRLVTVPQDPPAADGPLTHSADPRPLLARAQEALARYRSAVEDLAGGLDGESFHARTHGLRIGVVVDGESVWLYDAAHGHWVYADGTRANTYATDDTPRAHPEPRPTEPPAPAPARTPTRVVPAEAVGMTPRPDRPGPADQPAPPTEAPPTRVVPPEPQASVSREAAQPTRVVSPEAAEPTRVVSPEAPEPPRSVPPGAPEPTRLVSPAPGAPEPPRVATPEASESPRIVPPEAPEPTRFVPPEAPPTRVVSPKGGGAPASDKEVDRPAEVSPTRVVGSEPTRIVSPEGDNS
ncbi:hypothetical protein GCM10010244_54410 [Streptomyces coeruleorubidus]|nr:hypothetical protein GCM10010244_54410 [Streptomyces bellus]